MSYLYGIDFMLDKTINTEDSIKEHIKDNLESMNDDTFRKDIILVNNLENNRGVFVDLDRIEKYYDIFENNEVHVLPCVTIAGLYDVFIMLLREFCKEDENDLLLWFCNRFRIL